MILSMPMMSPCKVVVEFTDYATRHLKPIHICCQIYLEQYSVGLVPWQFTWECQRRYHNLATHI
ncbi:hypothetical protein ACHAXR_002414 [Thalassiosira sp. AJA248-18]